MIKQSESGKGELCLNMDMQGYKARKTKFECIEYNVADYADIVICDGGSTDGCTEESNLQKLKVNTLLVKKDTGKQGAQLRMGIWWALQRGYEGIITRIA